jgi:hypothetical protein
MLPSDRRVICVAALSIALFLMAVDIVVGSNGFFRFRDSKSNLKLTSASSISIRNYVLIIFESLGLFQQMESRKFLEATFETPNIVNRYDVNFGAVPFNGGTVSGEFRELCGLWAGVLEHPPAQTLSTDCLPQFFKKNGYETIAVHGFHRYMFDRSVLYPQMGFQYSMFRKDLLAMDGVHECEGAFIGVCDSDIAPLVSQLLDRRNRPQFLYWLTLDTHLPIGTGNQADFECKSQYGGIEDHTVCAYVAMVKRTLQDIATVAMDPKISTTEFIIVGDHAPPFLLRRTRALFDQEHVPYIHLSPRTSSNAGGD